MAKIPHYITPDAQRILNRMHRELKLLKFAFQQHRRHGFIYPKDLVPFQLAEDHPGRNTVFDIWLGTWNPATHLYSFDEATAHKAIDHRYGVPYPEKWSTGEGYWRKSDEHGRIMIVIALDCETPGS